MLSQSVAFLTKLKDNNNRDWFNSNRKEYEAAKNEFSSFVQLLIKEISEFDATLGNTSPKESIFRINRDIRFSNDKSPYKTNFGAFMAEGGKKSGNASYYFHLEPGNRSFAAGGLYMPAKDQLNMIRQEIDYNQDEFKAILEEPNFLKYFKTITGEKLKKAPKGYKENHNMIEILKHKSYIATFKISDDLVKSEGIMERLIPVYQSLRPLNNFLRRATTMI